jgi:hypothetical protein
VRRLRSKAKAVGQWVRQAALLSILGSGAVCVLAAASCDGDTAWVRFNADTDGVDVAVGGVVGEPVDVTLRSTTGTLVVGEASVSPGSGPVGTVHQVVVRVDDAYTDRVGRVSVTADAGERGERTFLLVHDSADVGLWIVDVASAGQPDEIRTDHFSIALFEEVPVEETDTP